MPISRDRKIVAAAALCCAVVLTPTLAHPGGHEDKAIATRQGYMQLVGWEAGPLFGMAKGEVDYDAAAAQKHAANLKLLTLYPAEGLFVPGTAKADRPGKTRALAEIWKDQDKFGKAFDAWKAAVVALEGEVGKGQPALAAAVAEMGKTCGGCHKPFRAEDF